MCPFCIATAALVTDSAVGTGGLALLVTVKMSKLTAARGSSTTINLKEVEHDHDDISPEAF